MEIKLYLTKKLKQLQAARIKYYFSEWVSYTMDKEILGSACGLSLKLSDKKLSHYHKGMEMRFFSKEKLFLADEIKNLLQKGAIKQS